MFRDKDKDYIQMDLSTTRYLARQDVVERFLDLLAHYGGVYIPERWDTQERSRRIFERASLPDIMMEWTLPQKRQYIFFHRKRPIEIQMFLRLERFAHAKFNDFTAYIRDKYFDAPGKVEEFLRFAIDLSSIISADYGFISHAKQECRQSPVLTPAERLPGIYWANFFGRPYIEFFGREKLLATPCYEVREISDDLILLLTADNPYRSEMVESDEVVNHIKEYLGKKAFAGPRFPDEPCEVPQFDFSDLRFETEPQPEESAVEKLARIRSEFEAKGYELIKESSGRLTLRAKDGSVAVFDINTGEVSLDTTEGKLGSSTHLSS